LATSFAACSSDEEPSPGPEPPVDPSERTVLIYMAADNNLHDFSVDDLNEMKKGSKALNTNQNLIVYVDQSSKEKPYFARIKDGKFIDSTSVNETSSSDPAVLEEALRYTREKYPALSYGLVLWGHADGWLIKKDSIVYAKSRAYGIDNGFAATWMNIPSMARAIKNGMNGEKLTFIHGDCCNFGSVEVAYELRNVTDYVIGSPAEIPDYGANYSDLSDLFDTSSTFYKKIIDKYWDQYLNEFKNNIYRYYLIDPGDLAGYSVPLIAIKTSELENLAAATAKLLNTIPDKLKPTGILNVSNVIFYAVNNGLIHNYDMYKTLKENTEEADFNAWAPAFEKAVPYYRPSARWYVGKSTRSTFIKYMPSFDAISSDCHVLAMFFPDNMYNIINPSWNTTIQQLQWNGPISWQQYGW
jgi:hypothetical protein